MDIKKVEGERLRKVEVIFKEVNLTWGMHGYHKPFLYEFNYNGTILVWRTLKELDLKKGEKYLFSGTFDTKPFYIEEEDHIEEYICVTRCIIKEI